MPGATSGYYDAARVSTLGSAVRSMQLKLH
jgi:hypothetical protein